MRNWVYLVFRVENQLGMIAGHDWAVEPGIIGCSKKTFADAFRSSADQNRETVWAESEYSLCGRDTAVQGCEGDGDY